MRHSHCFFSKWGKKKSEGGRLIHERVTVFINGDIASIRDLHFRASGFVKEKLKSEVHDLMRAELGHAVRSCCDRGD